MLVVLCVVLCQSRTVDSRLALFYLFDTLCKNRRIQGLYRATLAPFIAPPFISTYRHASELTRKAMDKLLTAWRNNGIFDSTTLDHISAKIRADNAPTPPPTLPIVAATDPRKRMGSADEGVNKVSEGTHGRRWMRSAGQI